jgi:hypothetical protein
MKTRRSDANQKRADDQRLLRGWRRWHLKQREEALVGPHGTVVAEVFDFLAKMTPDSAPALISLLRRRDWRCVDGDARSQFGDYRAARERRLASDRRRASERAPDRIPRHPRNSRMAGIMPAMLPVNMMRQIGECYG